MKKAIYLFIMISGLIMACENSDDTIPGTENGNSGNEIVQVVETCTDGIKNQDESEIDCGGVCEPCVTETVLLEEGNYDGLWNSSVTNGSVYTNLKVTATITKVSDTEYSGALYISDNYTSCCETPGNNGDGPITITIVDGVMSFKWIDNISFCTGEFNATGTYVDNNKLSFTNMTGKDCEGDHVGSLEFFK